MIKLKKITKENFWDVISLSVYDAQKEYVTSNAVSIAQSKIQPECIPFAVYLGDTPIGFTMHCIDTDDDEYWIYRMMIDKSYQSKGYGEQVMRRLLDIIKTDKSRNKIFLGVHKESKKAVSLYRRFGFMFNGQVYGKEHIMSMDY